MATRKQKELAMLAAGFIGVFLVCLFMFDYAYNLGNYDQKQIEMKGEIVGIDSRHVIVKDENNNLMHVEYEHRENLVETENGIMVYQYEKVDWIIPDYEEGSGYSLEPMTGDIISSIGYYFVIGLMQVFTWLLICVTKDVLDANYS